MIRGERRSPLVSVGLPVYNGERHVAEAIESLLAQTFEDFELIISDNASTDGTEEICRGFVSSDARIRYERNERNLGVNRNFNRIVGLARGTFYRWHAYDDLCAPTHLQRCVETLSTAPESVVLCYTRTRLIDEEGRVLRDYREGLDLRSSRPGDRLAQLVRNISYVNVDYGLLRTDAVRRTRLLQDYASSDYVFIAELALLGEFWEIPEYLFLRRDHPQMSTRANPTAHQLAAFLAPDREGRIWPEFWRVFAGHASAIRRAPLAPAEKARVLPAFLVAWASRRGRTMVREGLELLGIDARRLLPP